MISSAQPQSKAPHPEKAEKMVEALGEFWISGKEDIKLPGKLIYGDTHRLELFGTFGESLNSPETMLSIKGLFRTDGQNGVEGNSVTLLDCFTTNHGFVGNANIEFQNIHFDTALIGPILFDGWEDVEANTLTASIWPMTEWVHPNIIEVNHTPPAEPSVIQIRPYYKIPVHGCERHGIPFDLELICSASLTESGMPNGIKVKAEEVCLISVETKSGKESVSNLLEIIEDLKKFLTVIANIPTATDSIHFVHPQYPQEMIQVHQQWEKTNRNKETRRSPSLYELNTSRSNIGVDVIREWFKLCDKYGDALDWLLHYSLHTGGVLESRFQAAYMGLEGIWSASYGLEKSLLTKKKLAKFIQEIGEPFTSKLGTETDNIEKWAGRVIEIRNKRTAHVDHIEINIPLKEYSDKAQWLKSLGAGFLMKEMGIPNDLITSNLSRRL